MAETGLHELALLPSPKVLLHFLFPGNRRSLLPHRLFIGPAPGHVSGCGFVHDPIEITGCTIEIMITNLEIDHAGFHPYARLFAVGVLRYHDLTFLKPSAPEGQSFREYCSVPLSLVVMLFSSNSSS